MNNSGGGSNSRGCSLFLTCESFSSQFEIFLGFFLTAKLYDSYGSHMNHPLLDPLQTQEKNSGGGCLSFESTEVELIRALPNFQPFSS